MTYLEKLPSSRSTTAGAFLRVVDVLDTGLRTRLLAASGAASFVDNTVRASIVMMHLPAHVDQLGLPVRPISIALVRYEGGIRAARTSYCMPTSHVVQL